MSTIPPARPIGTVSDPAKSTIRPALEWERHGDYRDITYDLGRPADASGAIAKVTICRPEVRNAFRPQTLFELQHAFNVARDDPEVGVIVLCGQGDYAFCSGGDQRIRGDDGYIGDDDVAQAGIGRLNVLDLQIQIRRTPKPVVAMVAGYAVGGGHVLHVVCDLSIAADNAVFGQTGPKVGSFDGGYGSGLLAANIGQKRAREIWFLCRQYDAVRAYEMGLVNQVVELEALEEETVQWCTEMLQMSPMALRMIKGSMNAADDGLAGIQQLAGDATLLFYQTEEAQHGRDAYKNKERPDFSQFPGAREPTHRRTHGRVPMNRWLLGARIRTLPAAVVPVVVGTSAAVGDRPIADVRWGNAVLALVVALALQVATNFANDYSDGKRGTDDPGTRVGPPRLVGNGLATPSEVKRAMLLAFAVALLAGFGLVLTVGWELVPVGVAAVAAGWFYTGGPRPYGYAGFGEVFVFTFFGLVATVGSAYVQIEELTWLAVGCGVMIGCFATALLVVNNLRDIPGDTRSGKRTLAVRMGDRNTRVLYAVLMTLPYLLLPFVAGLSGRPVASLAFIAVLLSTKPLIAVLTGATGPALIPVLAQTSRVELGFGVLCAIGLVVIP